MFYGAIFGNLTAIIQRLYSKTAPYRQELRVIKDFTEYHEVPASLQKMLQCYITHEQASAAEDEIKTVRTRSLSRDVMLKWIDISFNKYLCSRDVLLKWIDISFNKYLCTRDVLLKWIDISFNKYLCTRDVLLKWIGISFNKYVFKMLNCFSTVE